MGFVGVSTGGSSIRTVFPRWAEALGLPTDRRTVAGLAAEARDHQARIRVQRRLRSELEQLGPPVLELPFLADGIDLSGLYVLMDALLEQGVHTA